jgi:hypothetical protein
MRSSPPASISASCVFRLGLGTVFEIILVALQSEVFADGMLGDTVRAGADSRRIHACRPDFGVIFTGVNDNGACEIFDRRRERALQFDAHLVGIEFFGALEPVHIVLGHHLVLGFRDKVQGVDHIIRREGLAVVELHALAEIHLQRLVVDPLPRRGELTLVFATRRVAIDQSVPDVLADNDADADVVEERIDVLRNLIIGKADRVAGFLRHGSGKARKQHETGDASHFQERPHEDLRPAYNVPGQITFRPVQDPVKR